jgi:hypothetical protein
MFVCIFPYKNIGILTMSIFPIQNIWILTCATTVFLNRDFDKVVVVVVVVVGVVVEVVVVVPVPLHVPAPAPGPVLPVLARAIALPHIIGDQIPIQKHRSCDCQNPYVFIGKIDMVNIL